MSMITPMSVRMAGQHGNPHFGLLHILSNLLIFSGFILLASAWNVLYRAQNRHQVDRPA